MPAVVPFIPAIAATVSTVGGLVQGNRQAKQNQQYIDMQDRQLRQVQDMAHTLVSRVSRAEYESQANRDVNAAMQDIFSVMAQRGMGRSTAALTAGAGAAAEIRSAYGKQYLGDRLSSLQSAADMIGGVAGADRRGFDSDPYAGFRSGISSIANGAAYYAEKGWPKWDMPGAPPRGTQIGFGANFPRGGDMYVGSGMFGARYNPNATGGTYGGTFGVKYPVMR